MFPSENEQRTADIAQCRYRFWDVDKRRPLRYGYIYCLPIHKTTNTVYSSIGSFYLGNTRWLYIRKKGTVSRSFHHYISSFKSFSFIHPICLNGIEINSVKSAGRTNDISIRPTQSNIEIAIFEPFAMSFSQPVYTPI